MQSLKLFIYLSLLVCVLSFLPLYAADIRNLWVEEDGAIIEIKDCEDGAVCGVIVGFKILEGDDDESDAEEEIAEIERLCLLEILTGIKDDGKKWSGGKILDPDTGKVYDASIKIKDKDLHLRAFEKREMFGKTLIWEPFEAEDDHIDCRW